MTRAAAAKRPPMRPTPSEAPKQYTAERVEINRILAQLAGPTSEDAPPPFRFDTWPMVTGAVYAADARWNPEDGGPQMSVTFQGARSVSEAEAMVLLVLRPRAAGVV